MGIFKTKLFKHQEDFLKLTEYNDKIFLADSPGLGKSLSAMALVCQRKANQRHCLIVVGSSGLKWNWKEEIEKHSYESSIILGSEIEKKNKYINKQGKAACSLIKDKVFHLKSIPKEFFWITNVESFRDKVFSDTIRDFCRRKIITSCIFDEIDRGGGKGATKTRRGILKIEADLKIAMTGTLIHNSVLDSFIVLKWLDAEEKTWTDFKNYHVEYDKWGLRPIAFKNLNEVQDKLKSVMIRRLKEDVFDLPPKIESVEYVEMYPEQQAIYNEVLNQYRKDIDKIKLLPNPLATLIRLQQTTGHTGILSSTVSVSAKFDRALEKIEEIVSNNEKVVIFSKSKEIINRFFLNCSKYNPALVTGDTKDEERQNQVNKFQNDNSCKIILGTNALGYGYTLTAARNLFHLDEDYDPANMEQKNDRIHRIGTQNSVNIYTFICKNTIDEKIHRLVLNKKQFSSNILDGKVMNNLDLYDWLLT